MVQMGGDGLESGFGVDEEVDLFELPKSSAGVAGRVVFYGSYAGVISHLVHSGSFMLLCNSLLFILLLNRGLLGEVMRILLNLSSC
jgi:hypothetical protein